ncbi:transcription antitermination factor NusB [Geothermobacter hydrogeniphilus]|uniref:Transcription antitermination protein NusB n=1 Tax=Geothermobacter hydrogeniphilus TaxID=1969733 RepID=A0A2K2H8A3_9BACT|nr:transcription antitermination factor NusB [Geothermobacter hydrogeniphilus]PNU19546.1 transcription antitermination factor NusB [Geothermobacter hydrogeniphilus]
MTKGIRRQGRELALKIIYSFPDQQRDIGVILDEFWTNFRFRDDLLGETVEDDAEGQPSEQVRQFAEAIASGTYQQLSFIDERLRDSSRNWSLDRMSRVDLALLRMGAYELLFCADVPTSVAINEAIEIGKRYGTRETPGFINGILDRIGKDRSGEI